MPHPPTRRGEEARRFEQRRCRARGTKRRCASRATRQRPVCLVVWEGRSRATSPIPIARIEPLANHAWPQDLAPRLGPWNEWRNLTLTGMAAESPSYVRERRSYKIEGEAAVLGLVRFLAPIVAKCFTRNILVRRAESWIFALGPRRRQERGFSRGGAPIQPPRGRKKSQTSFALVTSPLARPCPGPPSLERLGSAWPPPSIRTASTGTWQLFSLSR
jgi:hypothetical protein